MKIQKLFFSIGLGLTLSTAMVSGQIVLNFSNLGGASIQFNGTASTFEFSPSPGNQWSVTSETGGSSALGLQGSFSGGPWTIGSISTPVAGYQTANINASPSAQLTIYDGAAIPATADVSWVDIYTFGGAGGLNASAVVNLSNLSYAGANADLMSFFSSPAGQLVVTWQFNPAKGLTDLTTGTGPYNTSFSGSLTAVPEPGVLAIFGLGLALFVRRFFKK